MHIASVWQMVPAYDNSGFWWNFFLSKFIRISVLICIYAYWALIFKPWFPDYFGELSLSFMTAHTIIALAALGLSLEFVLRIVNEFQALVLPRHSNCSWDCAQALVLPRQSNEYINVQTTFCLTWLLWRLFSELIQFGCELAFWCWLINICIVMLYFKYCLAFIIL